MIYVNRRMAVSLNFLENTHIGEYNGSIKNFMWLFTEMTYLNYKNNIKIVLGLMVTAIMVFWSIWKVEASAICGIWDTLDPYDFGLSWALAPILDYSEFCTIITYDLDPDTWAWANSYIPNPITPFALNTKAIIATGTMAQALSSPLPLPQIAWAATHYSCVDVNNFGGLVAEEQCLGSMVSSTRACWPVNGVIMQADVASLTYDDLCANFSIMRITTGSNNWVTADSFYPENIVANNIIPSLNAVGDSITRRCFEDRANAEAVSPNAGTYDSCSVIVTTAPATCGPLNGTYDFGTSWPFAPQKQFSQYCATGQYLQWYTSAITYNSSWNPFFQVSSTGAWPLITWWPQIAWAIPFQSYMCSTTANFQSGTNAICNTTFITSQPTCGTASWTISDTEVSTLTYDRFCKKGGILKITSWSQSVWNIADFFSPSYIIDNDIKTILWWWLWASVTRRCFWDETNANSPTPTSGSYVECSSTVASNSQCWIYADNHASFNGVWYYSWQMTDFTTVAWTNAFWTSSNFCRLGHSLVVWSLMQNNTTNEWYWDCKDLSAVTVSNCKSPVRPSPDPICFEPLNPYTNANPNPVIAASQIDNTFCLRDNWHPDAGTPTTFTVQWGWVNDWQWTCRGGYYNEVQCTAPSYGLCGSANNSSVFGFNTWNTNLCSNWAIINISSGASSTSGVPFERRWTCRWSTTDWSTDQTCKSDFVAPVCWSAHESDFTTLNANNTNLCSVWTTKNFISTVSNDPQYDLIYTWECDDGTTFANRDASCEAYKPKDPVPGLCNPLTNNQSLTYAVASTYLQCTQWAPSAPLSLNPVNGVWTYNCIWTQSAWNDTCTINAVTNGQCTTYTSTVTTAPTVLCNSWTPTTALISSGSFVWDCLGFNSGTNTQCTVACTNGQCNTTNTWAINCTPTTWNVSSCPDGTQTTITLWQTCSDADGCICGQNTVLNWVACSSTIPVFPGKQADMLVVSHTVSSWSVKRWEHISFTLEYKNNWPDTATWAILEYNYSELLNDLDASMLFTVSWSLVSGNLITGSIASGNQILWASTLVYDRLLFSLWNLAIGQTWSITVSWTVRSVFGASDITNNAKVYSRVDDPNPLNNNKSVSTMIKDTLMEFDWYVINPLLTMKSLINRYKMIVEWINTPYTYRDILPWNERYMHIMTVTRMWIMQWYDYKYARYFSPKKCASYVEWVIVASKVMYMKWDDTVYSNMYSSTPFADANFNPSISNFINRWYRVWVIDEKHIRNENGKKYLDPNKAIKHTEMKEIMNRIYRLANADTKVLEPLLTNWNACVTREELAYTITHTLRGNSQIVMWFNDQFLKALYEKLQPLSIKERRYVINRIIFKLNELSPARLYKIGLDPEVLIWVLSAAMSWVTYNYNYDTSSADNFFYEISDDRYDDYISELFQEKY